MFCGKDLRFGWLVGQFYFFQPGILVSFNFYMFKNLTLPGLGNVSL